MSMTDTVAPARPLPRLVAFDLGAPRGPGPGPRGRGGARGAGRGGAVPAHLRDAHYAGAQEVGHGTGYRYAHDYPHHVAPQRYLPEDLAGTEYYRPTTNGFEDRLTRRVASVRAILRSG